MSYPNLPKSEYFQGFSAFRSCKASAFLHPQYQKSNKNLSLYRSKIFYRTYFWSIEAKTQLILYGFASILTKSERKSVYKKHGSDNSFHPILTGATKIIFIKAKQEKTNKVVTVLSVVLNIIIVLIFATTREVDALILVFLFLIIKGFLIFNCIKAN